MFYSIPISDEQTVTTTPKEARSVTHLFFEKKNEGLHAYKKEIDTVSMMIDGRQIAKDIPVMPFCTSLPYGVSKARWQDVALEVNLNVNFSEVKISAGAVNDYCVVLVCSDKEVDESRGCEFVEWRQFTLYSAKSFATVSEEVKALFSAKAKALKTEITTYYWNVWQEYGERLKYDESVQALAKDVFYGKDDDFAGLKEWIASEKQALTDGYAAYVDEVGQANAETREAWKATVEKNKANGLEAEFDGADVEAYNEAVDDANKKEAERFVSETEKSNTKEGDEGDSGEKTSENTSEVLPAKVYEKLTGAIETAKDEKDWRDSYLDKDRITEMANKSVFKGSYSLRGWTNLRNTYLTRIDAGFDETTYGKRTWQYTETEHEKAWGKYNSYEEWEAKHPKSEDQNEDWWDKAETATVEYDNVTVSFHPFDEGTWHGSTYTALYRRSNTGVTEGQEYVISLQHAPEAFCFFPYASDFYYDTDEALFNIARSPFRFTFRGGDNESLPNGVDGDLMSISSDVPMRKALYTFADEQTRQVSISFGDIEKETGGRQHGLLMIFIYRRLV